MTTGLNVSPIFDALLLSLPLVSVTAVADDDKEDAHCAEDPRRNGYSIVVKCCGTYLGVDVSNIGLIDNEKAIVKYCLAEKTVGR